MNETCMAEGEGFEPPGTVSATVVFKFTVRPVMKIFYYIPLFNGLQLRHSDQFCPQMLVLNMELLQFYYSENVKSGFGFADYLLYLDRRSIGALEAKAEDTLSGVEAQTAKYTAGLPSNLPAHVRPLPFLFESNCELLHKRPRPGTSQPKDIQFPTA